MGRNFGAISSSPLILPTCENENPRVQFFGMYCQELILLFRDPYYIVFLRAHSAGGPPPAAGRTISSNSRGKGHKSTFDTRYPRIMIAGPQCWNWRWGEV